MKRLLMISAVAVIALLATSGELAAMASRHHNKSQNEQYGQNTPTENVHAPQPISVPEPGTLVLLGSGLATVGGYFWVTVRRRGRRDQ